MSFDNQTNNNSGDVINVVNKAGVTNIKGQSSSISVSGNGVTNVNNINLDSVDIGPNANRKELRRFDDEVQRNIAIISLIITSLSALPAVIDLLGIIDLPLWLIILVFFMMIYIMWEGYDKELKYNLKVYLNKEKIGSTPFHLYDDKFVVLEDDEYVITIPDVKCIHPDCDGDLIIAEQPERRPQFNRNLFGYCSNRGKEHSYAIGTDFYAYRKDVDWRPKPKEHVTR